LTLRYLSSPSPGPKWYDFVARGGAILTGVKPAAIALEARNCVENARRRDGVFRAAWSCALDHMQHCRCYSPRWHRPAGTFAFGAQHATDFPSI
jgi:hypothetical protein